MKDELIIQALKEAIVEAFFNQKTIYRPDGTSQTYGGQVVGVVSKILESEGMQKMQKEMIREIRKQIKKGDLEGVIREKLEKEIFEKIRSFIKGSSYEFSEWARLAIEETGRKMAKEMVNKDVKVKELIRKAVGKKKYNLEITTDIEVREVKKGK